ncbi:MAG: response regulator transcription factor [Candidatus Promineifilaceae bacterium]
MTSIRTILAVDDSRLIVHSVSIALEGADYEVWTAQSGEDALDIIRKRGMPHLMLVDLRMPGMDGLTLCKKIHQFSDIPIIILTAIDEEDTIVTSLNSYAEDYITKPFRSAELVARVGRVLRRMGDFTYTMSPIVDVDARLQIDLPNRKIALNGERLSLTPIEAKFLYILMKNAGQTVKTDFLLRRIWPTEEAYEDRLHAHVYRLRKKIEANPKEPYYVVSDWGTGYSFPSLSLALQKS